MDLGSRSLVAEYRKDFRDSLIARRRAERLEAREADADSEPEDDDDDTRGDRGGRLPGGARDRQPVPVCTVCKPPFINPPLSYLDSFRIVLRLTVCN